MTSTETDLQLREKYRHFRILVIGRANAGKTTLLKPVCNTTEEPCIYDENGKDLVCFPLNLAKSNSLMVHQNKLEPTAEVGYPIYR
jgi:septin family protein